MVKTLIKPIILVLLGVLCGSWLNAQTIAPQSVNSVGIKMCQSNGSLSFTVGDLVVLPLTDIDGNTVGGGFTAGSVITTVSIQNPDEAVLIVKVFPNPTTELVNIRIDYTTLKQVIISVTDLQGNEVYVGRHTGISSTIGVYLGNYSPGTYVLSLKDVNGKLLGVYKIIKQ